MFSRPIHTFPVDNGRCSAIEANILIYTLQCLAQHTHPLDRLLLPDVGYVQPSIPIPYPMSCNCNTAKVYDTNLTFAQNSNRLHGSATPPHRAQES